MAIAYVVTFDFLKICQFFVVVVASSLGSIEVLLMMTLNFFGLLKFLVLYG